MTWNEVMIRVDRNDVADAERRLEDLGALAVTLEDDADDPVLEPAPGETPLWPVVSLRGLFAADADRNRVTGALQSLPCAPRPEQIHWRRVDDRDWVRAWMDRFEPMAFGRRLWVVPGGMGGPADPAAVALKLDPGLAFGTGTHPTTALCLEWLDAQDLAGARILDFGCGSGILAIAAVKLGAASAVAVDNDPQALEATRANAERNGVGDRIRCEAPGTCDGSAFDIVLANILAGPLIELAPVLVDHCAPGGLLLLSGLLQEQVDSVTAAYRSRCAVTGKTTREGWSRVLLEKSARTG